MHSAFRKNFNIYCTWVCTSILTIYVFSHKNHKKKTSNAYTHLIVFVSQNNARLKVTSKNYKKCSLYECRDLFNAQKLIFFHLSQRDKNKLKRCVESICSCIWCTTLRAIIHLWSCEQMYLLFCLYIRFEVVICNPFKMVFFSSFFSVPHIFGTSSVDRYFVFLRNLAFIIYSLKLS